MWLDEVSLGEFREGVKPVYEWVEDKTEEEVSEEGEKPA